MFINQTDRKKREVIFAQGRKLRVVGHICSELSCGISCSVTNGRNKYMPYNLKGLTL
jgi:hypothetical protein